MIRVAALYDIHGNLPALEAVLAEVARDDVDLIVVGGDVVPGPMPGAALSRLFGLSVPTRFIRGNGEADVLAARRGDSLERVPEQFRDVIRWVANGLPAQHLSRLGEWPLTTRVHVPGSGEVLFCHATPRNDSEIFTRLTPESRLRPIFEPTEASIVVCGHTHMQFDRTVGDVRVVNAGSVGMPFGEPGACWALLGDGVELRHTPYDLEAAASAIAATDYPQVVPFDVRRPPADSTMLEIFESAALSGSR